MNRFPNRLEEFKTFNWQNYRINQAWVGQRKYGDETGNKFIC